MRHSLHILIVFTILFLLAGVAHATEQFVNNCQVTLAGAVTTTAQTSWTISSANCASGVGTLPSGGTFSLYVGTSPNAEIVTVTNRVGGTTLTVVRGEGGTAAATYAVGTVLTVVETARAIAQIETDLTPATQLSAAQQIVNNVLMDSGTSNGWGEFALGGSLCPGTTLGDFEVCSIDGLDFVGTPPSATVANQFRCSNGTGGMQTCAVTPDPTNAIGQIPYASNVTSSPHQFGALSMAAAGSVVGTNGAGAAPILVPHVVNQSLATLTTVAFTSTNGMTDLLYTGAAEVVNNITFAISSTNACTGALPIMSLVNCGTTPPTNSQTQTAFCTSTTPITSGGGSNISVQIGSTSANTQFAPVTWTGTLTLAHNTYYAGRITGVGTACANGSFAFDIQGTITGP